MASGFFRVLCEKFPTASTGLFQHMDIILEAYRNFGDYFWFNYDEAFRHKLSIHPTLQWGVKDVGLWLNLFLPPRPVPPCPSTVSSSAYNTPYKKGICFTYNDSHCKWLNSCRYKHECAVCSGAHPVVKCFRKLSTQSAQQPRDINSKSQNAGEHGKHAALASGLPKQKAMLLIEGFSQAFHLPKFNGFGCKLVRNLPSVYSLASIVKTKLLKEINEGSMEAPFFGSSVN